MIIVNNGIFNNQALESTSLNQSSILSINNLLSPTSLTSLSLFVGTIAVEVSGGLVFILKDNVEVFIKDSRSPIFMYISNSDK